MPKTVLANLIITKINSASTFFTEKGTKIKRKSRPCWAMVFKYEGETVYTMGGKTYLSNSESVILLPKGASYDWVCTRSGHFCIIEFESDFVFTDEILVFPIKNSEKILKLFRSIEYKRNFENPMGNIENLRDCYSLFIELTQSEKKKYSPADKQKKISPAVDYIAQNYNKSIKNDELASLCGLSTVYFRKLFSQIYGVSSISYIHQLRIKKAKEMLKSDYASIGDIAHSLGYLNIYDFSRAFKKHVGISPSNYVKNNM